MNESEIRAKTQRIQALDGEKDCDQCKWKNTQVHLRILWGNKRGWEGENSSFSLSFGRIGILEQGSLGKDDANSKGESSW